MDRRMYRQMDRLPRRRAQHRPSPRAPDDARAGTAILARLVVLVGLVALAIFTSTIALEGLATTPAVAAQQSVRRAPVVPAAARLTNKVTLAETSIDGPGFAAHSTRAVLAWTGTDTLHHLNLRLSKDSGPFENKLTLGDTSPFHPAVGLVLTGASDPLVVVAWTGSDAAHTLNVLWNPYHVSGSPRTKLTLHGQTSIGSPGLFVDATDRSAPVFLAWTGTNANHSLNVLPLTQETLALGKQVVLPQFSSNAGPNLARALRGQLVLLWTTRTEHLNFATSTDGVQFEAPLGAGGRADLSAAAPDLVPFGDLSTSFADWLAWTGVNSAHNLNLQSTLGFPTSFPDPKTVLSDTALGGPQVGNDNNLLIAWTGTNLAHNLNVARFGEG